MHALSHLQCSLALLLLCVGVASTVETPLAKNYSVAALAAAPPGVEPQGQLLDPVVAPAAEAEAVVVGAGLAAVPAAATPGVGPRGVPPAPAAVPAVVPRVGRPPRSWGGA